MKSTGSFGWVYTIGAALTALIALLYFGGALDGLKPTPPVPAGLTSGGDTAGGAPAKPADEATKPAGDTAAPAADKPAEEAKTEAAADTAAAPADAAKAAAPSFDVVRVEPDGSTVVAGQAAPGSTVRLMAGDMAVGEAVADASGSFAIVLDKPLGAGSSDLSIAATPAGGGEAIVSEQRVAVSVPADGKGEVLVVLQAPGEASKVLSGQGEMQMASRAFDGGAAGGAPAEGMAGMQGMAGAEGMAGMQGMAGAEGMSGMQGMAGAEGMAGMQGMAGAEGMAGMQGMAGAEGMAGMQGMAGAEGMGGMQGMAGAEGMSGMQGMAGAEGMSGMQGMAGAEGMAGMQGMAGAEGMAGMQGMAATPVPVGVGAVEVEGGKLMMAGQATPGTKLRVYVDNGHVGDVTARADGTWKLDLRALVGAGAHVVRVDEISPADGKVVARAEAPFEAGPAGGATVAGGAEAGAAAPAAGAATSGVTKIEIVRGDNLWRIARKLWGAGARYSTIYEANRGQIRDPDLIFPGQVFVIPGEDTGPK